MCPRSSSTLSPNSHRNHRLPSRWSQSAWRNIDVSTVCHAGCASTIHTIPLPSGTASPIARPVRLPGVMPSSHSDLASGTVSPVPSTKNHASRLAPISKMVTTGVRRRGLSSWIGRNMSATECDGYAVYTARGGRSRPELLRGNRGALRERAELGPHDIRVDAARADVDREAAVDAGHDAIATDEVRIAADALRDELGMLDVVRLALDDAGDQ